MPGILLAGHWGKTSAHQQKTTQRMPVESVFWTILSRCLKPKGQRLCENHSVPIVDKNHSLDAKPHKMGDYRLLVGMGETSFS